MKYVLPLTLCLTLGGASASTAQTSLDTQRRVADAILAAQVKTNGVPGMAAALVRDGRVIWTGSAGHQDVERGLPITPSTSFRLASVSKLITATAAAVLHDRGKMNLDAPVQEYLPQPRLSWPAITARQLANHTSGIPHYQPVDDSRGGRRFATVGEAVGVFAGRDLLAAPGERYAYSSYGYTLLSAAVEARAGRPFLDFVAREITTGLDIRPDLKPDARHDTVAYAFADGAVVRAPPHDYSYSWGGAGYRGTARSVALFGARALDSRFLSASARRMMWTPTKLNDGSAVVEGEDALGFGWRIAADSDGQRIVHHAGVALGARSALIVYPDTADSLSLLSNAVWVSDIKETALMLAAPFRTPARPGGAPCPTGTMRYDGEFAGKPIAGAASFRIEDGICRGVLEALNAAGAWFNAFPQADSAELPVIAVTADGTLERAALVTPSGSYDLRRQADGVYAASLSPTRKLTVRLRAR